MKTVLWLAISIAASITATVGANILLDKYRSWEDTKNRIQK